MFEPLYDDAAEALAAYNLQSVGLDLQQKMALLKDIVAHTSVAQVDLNIGKSGHHSIQV